MKVTQLKSFGTGIDPDGKQTFIWVDKGRETDAMIHLFDKGWRTAEFIFEDCEIIN